MKSSGPPFGDYLVARILTPVSLKCLEGFSFAWVNVYPARQHAHFQKPVFHRDDDCSLRLFGVLRQQREFAHDRDDVCVPAATPGLASRNKTRKAGTGKTRRSEVASGFEKAVAGIQPSYGDDFSRR